MEGSLKTSYDEINRLLQESEGIRKSFSQAANKCNDMAELCIPILRAFATISAEEIKGKRIITEKTIEVCCIGVKSKISQKDVQHFLDFLVPNRLKVEAMKEIRNFDENTKTITVKLV